MTSTNEELGTIQSIFRIINKRKWYILLCLLGVLAPVFYYNASAVRVYQATATLIYEEPDLNIGEERRSGRYNVKETLLNHIQEIKSRSVTEAIIDSLTEAELARIPLPAERDANFNQREYYIRYLRKRIDAAPLAESDVIQVSVKSDNDPELARLLTDRLCDALKNRSLKIRQQEVSGVRAFIEEQQKEYRASLQQAENELRRFKVDNGVTIIDKEIEEQLQRATFIEMQYQEAKSNRLKTENSLVTLTTKLEEQQKNLAPSIADLSTQRIEQLKNQHSELQQDYINLQLQGIPESNSKMVQLRNDMEVIRKNIADEARQMVEDDELADPLSQISMLYQRKLELELELDTYKAQETSLQESLQLYEGKLRNLPEKEYELAQLTRERDLAKNIYLMLSERREQARINEAEKFGSIRIIDRPELPMVPIWPRTTINLLVAVMLGLTLGFGLTFLLESLDATLKTPSEIEDFLKLPALGVIPYIPEGTKTDEPFLVTIKDPTQPGSEAFRTLRTNLQFARNEQNIKSIVVTSSGPQEGKSTASINLAIVTAQMGIRTLLIDADLRRPSLHKSFEINQVPGLTDFMNTNGYLEGHFQSQDEKLSTFWDDISGSIQKTFINGLEFLPAGSHIPNPAEVLAHQSVKFFITQLAEKYDVIIIDAPPLIAVTDAAVLAQKGDAVLLVVESGRNESRILMQSKTLLHRVGATLLGIVVNSVNSRNLYGRYDYYYNYYTDENKGPRRR